MPNIDIVVLDGDCYSMSLTTDHTPTFTVATMLVLTIITVITSISIVTILIITIIATKILMTVITIMSILGNAIVLEARARNQFNSSLM